MTPDRASALLALTQASNALHIAHTYLVDAGATEQAEHVHREANRILNLIGKLTTRRVIDVVGVVS